MVALKVGVHLSQVEIAVPQKVIRRAESYEERECGEQ